jgi:DNA-binding response OmpR family regulator
MQKLPAKKTTILTADDDPQILRLVTRNLQFEGYQVLTATNGQEALEQIEAKVPNLVLLDVMMPKLDGFTVCQRVREFSTVPIIIITARGQESDRIRGLDLGADDYLTKPFSVDELLARVRAVLRRSEYSEEKPRSAPATISIGDITVDFAQHLVTCGGKEIDLTPIEYRVFTYLVQNAGRVLTQNMLLEQVWGAEYVSEHHMLQVNINRLRRKLEPDPAHPRYILTKPGVGYLFTQRIES